MSPNTARAFGPPIRVLIVDDAEDIRVLLRFSLMGVGGFEIVGEAEDGAQAIAMAESTKPDAVLLDLAMPVMDGLQAAPEIKRVSPDTKIVILSGFSMDRMGAEASGAGADRYMEKGTPPNRIAQAIVEVCGGGSDPGAASTGGGEVSEAPHAPVIPLPVQPSDPPIDRTEARRVA